MSLNSFKGQTYTKILNYFYPEYITSLILYFGLSFLDSWFISKIQVSYYAALGTTNTLIHFITKIAEGFSVGVIVLCGQYNGIGEYKKVGNSVVVALWLTCIIGAIISGLLYFGAPWIYYFFEVPESLIEYCAPFLQMKSIGIFFKFVFFALVGFLRGIKNTKTPMAIFIGGAIIFAFFDYSLIFGKFGFIAMEFQGSALAYTIQYAAMFFMTFFYIIFNRDIKKYNIEFFSPIKLSNIMSIVDLSWPVVFDKASFALCGIWLSKMVGCMAKLTTIETDQTLRASLTIINDIERFIILPGVAFAQVITFLVSNDYKSRNLENIKANIKRIFFASFIITIILLFIFSFWPHFFIYLVDKDGSFVDFAAKGISIISILVFFDLLQLILSAILRGSGNTKIVMWVRIIGLIFFIPIAYLCAILPIDNIFYKFIILYSLIYIIDGFMGIYYLKKLKELMQKNN